MANDPASRPPEKFFNDKESSDCIKNLPETINSNNKSNNDKNNKEKVNMIDEGKKKSKNIEDDTLMAKTPQHEDTDTTYIERALQLATQAVIINKRITTPVMLETQPVKGRSNINVALVHLNIFIAIKKIDPTLKLITEKASIDTVIQFPKGDDYTKLFTNLFKDNRTSTVYITHKMESAKSVSDLKHGTNNNMTHIFFCARLERRIPKASKNPFV